MDLYCFICDIFPVSVSLSLLIAFIPGPWDFGAYNGRLYKQDDRIKKRIGGWCARDKKKGHWLQVDLGKIKFVTAVATQGKRDSAVFMRVLLALLVELEFGEYFLCGERKQTPRVKATTNSTVNPTMTPGARFSKDPVT